MKIKSTGEKVTFYNTFPKSSHFPNSDFYHYWGKNTFRASASQDKVKLYIAKGADANQNKTPKGI